MSNLTAGNTPQPTPDSSQNAERAVLQAALDWNEEYKFLNHLIGSPYWVAWANTLGMKGQYMPPPHTPKEMGHKPESSQSCSGCADGMPVRSRNGELWHIYEGETAYGRKCTAAQPDSSLTLESKEVTALERAKMTFFYIRNLSHDAWRDPENLRGICKRIEDYAKMEYDLLTAAIRVAKGESQ